MLLRTSLFLLLSTPFFCAAAQPTFSEQYRAFQHAVADEKLDEALVLSESVLALGKAKFGENSEQAQLLAFSHANMQITNGHLTEGLAGYEKVEEYYAETFGESSPEYMEMLITFVENLDDNVSMTQVREYNHKREYLRELLLEMPEIEGEQHVVAPLYYRASVIIAVSSNIPVSGASLNAFMAQAYATISAEYGDDDYRTAEALFVKALANQADRKNAQAIEQFEQVIAWVDKKADYTHPYELSAHAKLVSLYEARGESDKATEHCVAIGQMTPWDPEQEAHPLYRQNPRYPSAAARSRKQGWAKLRFDINKQGFVDNIEVIEVDGSRYFGDAAQEALENWRYAPKFEAGQAVVAKDNYVRLDFKIAQ